MKNSFIKRMALVCIMLFAGIQLFAQGRIELNPNSRGEKMSESSLQGFRSTFSFSSIESKLVRTEAGEFSAISIPNTISVGEVGAPAVPAVRKLVGVPFGATPVVKVVSYTTTEYSLDDYEIKRVCPQQPSYRKDTKASDMVFQYDSKAYQTRGFREIPAVSVEVLGTIRGIQLGAIEIEPVSYNPTDNRIRVFNDIEVEVVFEDADVAFTEETLVKTYSPYFDIVYKQLFNSRAIADVYDDYKDLYKTPVRMIAIADRKFENVIQPWIEWKTKKGFYLEVKYTDQIGKQSSQIMAYIRQQYNANAPTFLVLFGDETQVVPSMPAGDKTNCVTDIHYASINGDKLPEIYCSRMSCETEEEMKNLVDKILQYEQYTMPDPSYLNNALMIAGADDMFHDKVGKPAIQYATNYYYNQSHGFDNVYAYINSYGGCYNNLSTGVGFLNYTAHGSQTYLVDPRFSNEDVNNLTNKDKYFWVLANCCQTGDFGYDDSACFAETMLRAKDKGAWGYIGSSPVTYWYEDYYFAVGATTVYGKMPKYNETEMGAYDAIWVDDTYNTLASVPFIGNVSVTCAHSNNYTSQISTEYYWEAYHVFGDGSVMPYRVKPGTNEVSHESRLVFGMDEFRVSAKPSSYVGISKDGVLLGAAMVDNTGVVNVPITPVTSGGDVCIVVTHPRYAPYIETIPTTTMSGPYAVVLDMTPQDVPVEETTMLSVSLKNFGTEALTGTATLKMSSDDVTFTDSEATFSNLAVDATMELNNQFAISVPAGFEDGDYININTVINYGTESWEGKNALKVIAPVFEFVDCTHQGSYEPGETYTFTARFKNVGHYTAKASVAKASSSSSYVTIAQNTIEVGNVDPEGIAVCSFDVTISPSCPTTEKITIDIEIESDNGAKAEGSGMMKNECEVEFNMYDSFGDGWSGASLTVKFDNGDPDINLTFAQGESKSYVLTINIGTHVSVYFNKGQFDFECTYEIKYKEGDELCSFMDISAAPTPGLVCEFDVHCGGSTPDPVELNPVKNLEAKVFDDDVNLTWETPGNVKHYIIRRNSVEVAKQTSTIYVDSNLPSGSYTYSVVAVYEEGESVPVTVSVDIVLGVDEDAEVLFAIYPNPAKDYVYVKSNANKLDYQLINSIGQIILSGNLDLDDKIDISGINNGVYFIKVIADGNMAVKKIFIQ